MRSSRKSVLRTFLLALVLTLPVVVGCQTSESIDSGLSIEFPNGEQDTILESRLDTLEAQARKYPKRADLHHRMAAIHFQSEDWDLAEKSLEKAARLKPNHIQYHYDLGRVRLQINDLKEAERAFTRAAELDSKNRWSGLHSALGYTLCKLHEWDRAKKEFEISIRIDQDDIVPYYFLGSIADIQDDRDQAIRYLREYVERGGKSFRTRAEQILQSYGVKVEYAAASDDADLERFTKASAATDELPVAPVDEKSSD